MRSTKQILVVVDPTAAAQPALGRAALVAARMGWSLRLLACVPEGLPRRTADPEAVRGAILDRQRAVLKDLARGYPDCDVAVKAVWDRPLHEAIIRETLRSEPRFVMKDTHFHAALSRALFTNTDWHLIRDCPAPLWLVRGAPWPAHPAIAAFVDPMHEHDKPADLDHRILTEASRLAVGLDGEVHAIHCRETASTLALGSTLPGALDALPGDGESEHAAVLGALAAAHAVPPARVHLRSGPAATEIPLAAHALGADLAVMGAVSRSRLQQAFLGHTAERVLERLACDVLVLKPAKFESPVTYRAQPADFMEST
jgi:universal stress protein E